MAHCIVRDTGTAATIAITGMTMGLVRMRMALARMPMAAPASMAQALACILVVAAGAGDRVAAQELERSRGFELDAEEGWN